MNTLHHVMLDIDGTLVESFSFDEECYLNAVFEVLGHRIDSDWRQYTHVTDSGILHQHLKTRGLLHLQERIHFKVKETFVANIGRHVEQHSISEIKGARLFVEQLKARSDVSLSIATGGWEETARIKLEAVGLDVTGIPVASSNDHFSRTEIMRIALEKAFVKPHQKVTYFGDGEWDKKACEKLGFNFVLVGNNAIHDQAISDFDDLEGALSCIGLV